MTKQENDSTPLEGYEHNNCCDFKHPHSNNSFYKMRREYFCSRERKVMFRQNESAGKFNGLLFIRVIMSQEILAKKLLFCVAVSQLKPSAAEIKA